MSQSPGELGASRAQAASAAPESSDILWTVTYMRYPHQGERKAIIVTNQPGFCLCCLAGHMVWKENM